jgi:hypothetical protein
VSVFVASALVVVSLLLSLLWPDLLDEATTRRVKRFRPRRECRDFDIGSPPSRGKSGRRAIPDAPLQDPYPPEPLWPSPPEPDESEPDESEPDESKPDESKPDESDPDESEPDESETEVDESEPVDSEPGPLLLASVPEVDDSSLGPLEFLSALGPLESGCESGSPLGLSCEPGPELSEAG